MTLHTDSAAQAGFPALLTSTIRFRALVAAIVAAVGTLTLWTAVEAAAIDEIVNGREYASVHVLEREGAPQDGPGEYASVRVLEREVNPQDEAREYASIRVMEREHTDQSGPREYTSVRVAEREGARAGNGRQYASLRVLEREGTGAVARTDLTDDTRLAGSMTVDVDALQLHELRRFRGHVTEEARADLETAIDRLAADLD
jgi:hypothetical protein